MGGNPKEWGRPVSASAKLTVRLTEAESRILRSQAIRNGQSLSAFARQRILQGGGTSTTEIEQIVGQILPVIAAQFDALEDQIQIIRSEVRQADERSAERLKQAANFLARGAAVGQSKL